MSVVVGDMNVMRDQVAGCLEGSSAPSQDLEFVGGESPHVLTPLLAPQAATCPELLRVPLRTVV